MSELLKENDKVSFTYYTETKSVTGSGKLVWIGEHDCVVKTKNGKRHMMQVSALKTNSKV